jgi:hypothetical protein
MKYFVLFLAVLAAGCAGKAASSPAFSREWAEQLRHDDELKARGLRTKAKSKDPGGTNGGSRTEFPSGFENRRSGGGGISVGGDSGLGGTLNKDGGSIRYKFEW